MDELKGRLEGPTIKAISSLIGHETMCMLLRSRREFQDSISYIAQIDKKLDADVEPDRAICLHLSCHGNSNGLQIGRDEVSWSDLVNDLQPVLTQLECYDGPVILVFSACHAEDQAVTAGITKVVKKSKLRPPEFVFTTTGEVRFDDAAVAWTVFYHLLPNVNFAKKASVQGVLDKLASLGLQPLRYFRWDESRGKYLKYTGQAKS